jgi:putative hydrolase
MIWDFHSHTRYSHGKGTIEESVIIGMKRGLKKVAITEHGPGHLAYGVSMKKMKEMKVEIEKLKDLYPEIEIVFGVEANISTKGNLIDVKPEEMNFFDIVLAGYHYGILGAFSGENFLAAKFKRAENASIEKAKKGSLLVRNTEMVVNALYKNDIFMLTHPGDKGPFDILELAKACEATDTLMEISNWHPHLDEAGIKTAAKTGVKFAISSDAHSPERIGGFTKGLKRAQNAGLDLSRIVNIERI